MSKLLWTGVQCLAQGHLCSALNVSRHVACYHPTFFSIFGLQPGTGTCDPQPSGQTARLLPQQGKKVCVWRSIKVTIKGFKKTVIQQRKPVKAAFKLVQKHISYDEFDDFSAKVSTFFLLFSCQS